MAPMTCALNAATGLREFIVELSTDESMQAAVEAGDVEASEMATLTVRIPALPLPLLLPLPLRLPPLGRHGGRDLDRGALSSSSIRDVSARRRPNHHA